MLPLSGDERREKVIVGISTGIMCAASFWSLFGPAGEQARSLPGWIKTLPTAGFLCGWGTIYLSSVFLQRDISDKKLSEMYPLYWQSPFTICRRGAIGVAFGVAEMSGRAQNYTEAWLLALGIGLQNIPDGFSVTAPLKKGGATNTENFFGGNCPVWRSG